MKKNIIIITICLLIIVITAFLGYKIYYFRKFSLNNYRFENVNNFVKNFSIKDTISFKNNNNLKDNFLEYQNIKIANNYQDFVKDEESMFQGETYRKYDDNDRVVIMFSYGIENYTIYDLIKDMKAFSVDKTDKNNIKRTDPVDIDDYLKENKINDDSDLIKYAYEHKDDKVNFLLDSVMKRKTVTFVYSALNMFLGNYDDIYLVKGDLNGYIGVKKKDNKGINVIKVELKLQGDNKQYYFIWDFDEGYYHKEDIENFINAIQIS